jgi:hypothetical protein
MLSNNSIPGWTPLVRRRKSSSNGHRQSPSTKRVKFSVPFAVVGLAVVIQSNLLHFLDVHAVVLLILFVSVVCSVCINTAIFRKMIEIPFEFYDFRRSDPLNANLRPKYGCVLPERPDDDNSFQSAWPTVDDTLPEPPTRSDTTTDESTLGK